MIDTTGWRALGRTLNATVYELLPRILVAVPDERADDDASTAEANLRALREYERATGASAVCFILFDRFASQSAEARRVYTADPDPRLDAGIGLVTSSLLGRAMASFFLGLCRTPIPVRTFATVSAGLPWALSLLQEPAGAPA